MSRTVGKAISAPRDRWADIDRMAKGFRKNRSEFVLMAVEVLERLATTGLIEIPTREEEK